MSSKVLYEEKYTDDVISMLLKNKYWVFADGMRPKEIAKSRDIINKRFVKAPGGGLQITCLKNDKDFTNSGLNPRAELRLENFKLGMQKHYRVTCKVNFPHLNAGFEFFQIMVSGPARPVCQFEVRKNKIGARHSDGKNLIVLPLLDEQPNKDMLLEIEFCLDQKNGYINFYKDGVRLWSKAGATVFGSPQNAWLQYGVYKNGTGTKEDNSVIYRYFKIEELQKRAREIEDFKFDD